jgi:hypothetical protein
MATALWIAIGVLLALLSWMLAALSVVVPLVMLGLAIGAVLVPREVTAVLAKAAMGFGGTWVVVFSPNVIRDPLGASAATYLLFGGGLLLVALGTAAVVRNRARRRRLARIKAAEAVLT